MNNSKVNDMENSVSNLEPESISIEDKVGVVSSIKPTIANKRENYREVGGCEEEHCFLRGYN